MIKFVILVAIAIGCKTASAQWCPMDTCGNAVNTHIDCTMGEEGSWGSSCPAEKAMLNLRDVQEDILADHNVFRNKVAGGQQSGLKQANRMGTMVWNVTLANLARKTVRTCELTHDGCRNPPGMDFVGQNMGYYKYAKWSTATILSMLKEIIALWCGQVKSLKMADVKKFPGRDDINSCSQILKYSATRIGCAASKVTLPNFYLLLFACNYDMGNVRDWSTYEEGTAASACKAKNPTYKNLCSTSEVYNVNTFWEDTPHVEM